MDYHHTDIRFKAASEGWKTKEEQENMHASVCLSVCVYIGC